MPQLYDLRSGVVLELPVVGHAHALFAASLGGWVLCSLVELVVPQLIMTDSCIKGLRESGLLHE